jgi:hypothetical protein
MHMKTLCTLLAAALLAGCVTTEPGEMEYAKLTVPRQDQSHLRARIETHFGLYRWNLKTNAPSMMVFERFDPAAQLNRDFNSPPVMREARVLFLDSPEGIIICAGKMTVNHLYAERTEFMESPAEMRKILAAFHP